MAERTVHKHVVDITSPITVMLPIGAKLLLAGPQPGVTTEREVALWFEVPVVSHDACLVPFRYHVFGTGHGFEEEVYRGRLVHAASWQAAPFVWHLYQVVQS